MPQTNQPDITEILDGLNDDDEVPTDGELRATGANGPKASSIAAKSNNVESQISHSLVEHASTPAPVKKSKREEAPPC